MLNTRWQNRSWEYSHITSDPGCWNGAGLNEISSLMWILSWFLVFQNISTLWSQHISTLWCKIQGIWGIFFPYFHIFGKFLLFLGIFSAKSYEIHNKCIKGCGDIFQPFEVKIKEFGVCVCGSIFIQPWIIWIILNVISFNAFFVG